MDPYVPARTKVVLSPGDSVRIARESQEMTLSELALAANMTEEALSAIEGGEAPLARDQAERLAVALKLHPNVLLEPMV